MTFTDTARRTPRWYSKGLDADAAPLVAWQPQVLLLALVAGALTGAVGIVASMAVWQGGTFGSDRYELWRWEAETLPMVMLELAGFGPDGLSSGSEQAVQRYFALTSEMRAELEQAAPDLGRLAELEAERDGYENAVEAAVEARIEAVIASEGADRGLPLFSRVSLVWPPVAFELTAPPQVLVRSPRDHIERAGDTLLKNDLDLATIEAFEAAVDDGDTVSLVVPIGGLAAYPAIVREDRNYYSILSTAAHEWVHHYLAFFPLGAIWGESQDGIALNETTANIAEREIARLVTERYPVAFEPGLDGAAPARPATTLDFNSELRALRLEVDALLEEGRVEEAERLMNERRHYLEENGFFIRKINQAYFAFYGSYADAPASTDPIGPKVERVWELTGTLAGFLGVMREVTSVDDLDAALAALEAVNQ